MPNNLQMILENTLERKASNSTSDQIIPADPRPLAEKIEDLYGKIGQMGATVAQIMSMSSTSTIEARHPLHGIFGIGRQMSSVGQHHPTRWLIIWIVEVNGVDEHQSIGFDAVEKKAFLPDVPKKMKKNKNFVNQATYEAGKVALEVLQWLVLEHDDAEPLVRSGGVSMSHDRLGERLLIDRMASWFAACCPEREFYVSLDDLGVQDRLMFRNSERRGWIEIEFSEEFPKMGTIKWTDMGLKVLARLFLS